jgi:AcrR family transcriptional regulator
MQGVKMSVHVKSSSQKENILAAAAQLFAHQGYHGTTTREIARLADVSENTIFRHFDRKEDLFWSALRSKCSALKLRRDVVDGMAEGGTPEVVLPKIIEYFTDILNYSPELVRLIAVALLEMQWKADLFCAECLAPAFTTINRYLETVVEAGRVRKLDPTMVTAALTTMVLVYPWFSRHTVPGESRYPDSRAAERAYTAFWLEVLEPRPGMHDSESRRIGAGFTR